MKNIQEHIFNLFYFNIEFPLYVFVIAYIVHRVHNLNEIGL